MNQSSACLIAASSSEGLRREAGADGFVIQWLLYRAGEVRIDDDPFERDYLNGESQCVPGMGNCEGRKWVAWRIPYGYKVDLHRVFCLVTPPGVAYGACWIISNANRTVSLRIGSDDGHKLWVNHEYIGGRRIERGLGVDQDIYDVHLKEGANLILLKLEHVSGAFEFCLRLTETDGAVASDLRVLASPSELESGNEAKQIANLTDNDLLSHLLESQSPALRCRYESPEEFHQWQADFREALAHCLGDAPLPVPSSTDILILRREEEDGYVRETIHYELFPGAVSSAYLLLPTNPVFRGPFPVIINLPGHGAGKDHIVGIVQREKQRRLLPVLDWEISYASAPIAARMGFAVFVPEFLAFGDRLGTQLAARDSCDHAALWAMALGCTLPRLNALAISRGIDHLQVRADLDTSQLSVMGHSLGGFMSMLIAAIEPRIKAAVVSGMLGSFSMAKGGTWFCGSQTIPGILRHGDMVEIAALIAPRPLLVISGRYDCCAPVMYVEQAYRTLEQVYRMLGHGQRLERFDYPGDHIFQPEAAIRFLRRWHQ